MEENKNVLANLYGARVSKNGKWLNLIFIARIDGEEKRFTCPVRLATDYDGVGGKKPYARLEKACTAEGVEYIDKALIANIPVYADNKKDEPKKPVSEDFPF